VREGGVAQGQREAGRGAAVEVATVAVSPPDDHDAAPLGETLRQVLRRVSLEERWRQGPVDLARAAERTAFQKAVTNKHCFFFALCDDKQYTDRSERRILIQPKLTLLRFYEYLSSY